MKPFPRQLPKKEFMTEAKRKFQAEMKREEKKNNE